jgi:mono/diheme cytochrome c family protein
MRRLLSRLRLVAALLFLALAAVHALAGARLTRSHAVEVRSVPVSGTAEARARGRHLVEVVGQCTTCHGEDLGGAELADDLWLGRLWAPNLTPGRGGLADRSDAELVGAIRHGVKPDGRPVVMMPSQYYNRFSDADLGAILAYLRTLEPIERVAPSLRMGPLTAVVILSGQAPDLLPAELLSAESPPGRARGPAPAHSPDYGAYLVDIGGCKVCHRQDLQGGLHPLSLPDEPPPPDLTPGGPMASWSEDDFVRTLRTGVTPDGRHLDAEWMPWPAIARMTDLELRAIWLHLRSLR